MYHHPRSKWTSMATSPSRSTSPKPWGRKGICGKMPTSIRVKIRTIDNWLIVCDLFWFINDLESLRLRKLSEHNNKLIISLHTPTYSSATLFHCTLNPTPCLHWSQSQIQRPFGTSESLESSLSHMFLSSSLSTQDCHRFCPMSRLFWSVASEMFTRCS